MIRNIDDQANEALRNHRMLKASARTLYKGSQAGDSYVREILKKADSGEIEKIRQSEIFLE